jgi:hypothetical protein
MMTTMEAIKSAVSKLKPQDLARFRAWFEEYDATVWDKQFEDDVRSGKLDKIANQALVDFEKGNSRNYEAFYQFCFLKML